MAMGRDMVVVRLCRVMVVMVGYMKSSKVMLMFSSVAGCEGSRKARLHGLPEPL
jgi:hypothetical protein